MELFKYLRPSRLDVIENLMIRFSRPNDFNDPFESLPCIGGIKNLNVTDDFYKENIEKRMEIIENDNIFKYISKEDLINLSNEAKEYLSNMTIKEALNLLGKQDLFTTIITQYPDKVERTISTLTKEKWNDKFGILCLSEKHDNLIMWAHYAQNHEGFVIGFNANSPFFDQRKSKNDYIRSLRKVIYEENRPEMTLYDNKMRDQELNEYIVRNTLFTKSYHWTTEEEWRMVMNLEDADVQREDETGKSYLFNFPASIISSIYLGVRITDQPKNKIIQIIKERGDSVPIYQGYLDQKKYLLDFKKIN